ncbi:hypothetical protein [Fimbriimonas ginsengisoli]|uniref:Uncharacterized protein n=1 Tax=Fimbriimonas ginsengisoli Gsoil 348 TaxID=661478 RepID=A0A068NP27_FIMGI|nr:hypothetical protein [Fimbriimonas ginsengisoli]AIE85191.1 hypothetical protein OP10G_1823 [Fimbriimonas ginsengisoli Gsoil 348]
MSSQPVLRVLSTMAGVLGLALLLFAFVLKALSLILFLMAATVFILALATSVAASRNQMG